MSLNCTMIKRRDLHIGYPNLAKKVDKEFPKLFRKPNADLFQMVIFSKSNQKNSGVVCIGSSIKFFKKLTDKFDFNICIHENNKVRAYVINGLVFDVSKYYA